MYIRDTSVMKEKRYVNRNLIVTIFINYVVIFISKIES